ncbi:MAG: glycoside hydrolase family 3 C-terminal domain-containing protein [Clostridia bacterium]|nr:glycoside hydrolase family 3 C-terminal domain-containing protein [Clostridia bacterium]
MHYANLNPAVPPMERAHAALARRAAMEGFVLLQNNHHALPLVSQKIALYGAGARKTLKGGVGSGEVNERRSVTIEQGLLNMGYEVTSTAWLDDFDAGYDKAYADWKAYIAAATAGINTFEVHRLAKKTPFVVPDGRPITEEDVAASETDTALFVITRQAGESFDRKPVKGDYYLTDDEREKLAFLGKAYAKTILILNCGAPLDMGFLDEIEGIDAVVFMAQGGCEGGNALAEVLSGYENFSGKLTDTWAYRLSDHPSTETFSDLDGDTLNEPYHDGIYVGYRYFDRFGVAPRYPFGFGLSYTTFVQSDAEASLSGTTVSISVTVENTGAYAGKEVVQLYTACPVGTLEKESKRLSAFAKTGLLAPGASERVTLSFDIRDAASYDEIKSAWVLEAGDYTLLLGTDADSVCPVARVRLDQSVLTEQCERCCAPKEQIDEITPPAADDPYADAEIATLPLSASPISTETHSYEQPTVPESPWVKEKLDSLTLSEMGMLVRGAGVRSGLGEHIILGAGGRTATCLREKGIPNIVVSDGPAGLNIVNTVKIADDGMEYALKTSERWNVGAYAEQVKKMRMMALKKPGVVAYRYVTAWPAHILLAQTWNTDLVREVGDAMGAELIAYGVTVWLAPGMNIHRNPLCGRTFEYFAEDPYLTGKMAAAITQGVQTHKGVGVSLKHFACNSQEANRSHSSSNLNERALREIYLKGFEIAVKESNPMTVMSSYNKINGTFNGTNYDLLTKILRCEWGFKGLVMTDFNAQCDAALCAPTGNDLYMYGDERDKKAILDAIEAGTLTEKDLRPAAARVLALIENSAVFCDLLSKLSAQ